MVLAELLLALIKENHNKDKVAAIIQYLKEQYNDIQVAYFSYSAVDKGLIELNGFTHFKQNDYMNPLVLSFAENRKFLSNKVVSYPDDSSFKQYSQKWGGDKYCVLFPIRNIGIFAIYGKDKVRLNNNTFLSELSLIAESFLNMALLHQANRQLEEQCLYFSQALNKNRLHDYELHQRNYIEQHWIDETASGKRFKRRLADLALYDRNVAMVAEAGYGKRHLVNIIHQLRSLGLTELKEIDLLQVNNVIQLNEIIKHKFELIQRDKKDTLLINNIECLTDYLIERLIKLLSQEKLMNSQVKIILTVTNTFFMDKQNQLRFFSEDKIILPNRIAAVENRELFLRQFAQSSNIDMLSHDVVLHIVNEKRISEIKQMKFLVTLAFNRCGSFSSIKKSDIDDILSQRDWYQPDSLEWNVAFYERSLIRQSLVKSNWSQRISAEKLNIPRRTLNYKCQKYGLRKNG
ncbi:transcriptional regulator with AAA-type ATPase domain [Cricetibacter osteomyelitidis]|uniref:Transcriptional regulator with AAA-type ATPase domain n=1 Tax=Cricetibacter osteomyelitidis TaxID=1521931 RepID=A0A4R2SMD4_9PAST|nr:helix-turn-helix domain-containing protein [Cricetibacter osteomyelitidis]TCP91177.1 transcriptional regulator with AAA-type ATPase domain [Cricetibacter osteomyelitidis]